VAEAAFAAALGIQLGGENRYGDDTEVRCQLGRGRTVVVADIGEAIRLSRDCTAAFAGALLMGSLISSSRARR